LDFAEVPPSRQWQALKYRGEPCAEVWFKPENQPLALAFRVPRASFDNEELAELLTAANLLGSVGISVELVDSWRIENAGGKATADAPPTLEASLPRPEEQAEQLHLLVQLKPTPKEVAQSESPSDIPEAKWNEIESRWNAVLGLEASLETLRISVEGARAELDSASRRVLTGDDKIYAMNADVAQWSKAKNRALFALPKAREFIHRATWATSSPERKKLEELFRTHIRGRVPFPDADQVLEQLEHLLKERQVLAAHGTTVLQDCKAIAAEVQGCLRTLQTNASANAIRRRAAANSRGRLG
jgi:hypothetical protein